MPAESLDARRHVAAAGVGCPAGLAVVEAGDEQLPPLVLLPPHRRALHLWRKERPGSPTDKISAENHVSRRLCHTILFSSHFKDNYSADI